MPYGAVESLVTLQAENLGSIVQTVPAEPPDLSQVSDLIRTTKSVFICDPRPTTAAILKLLAPVLAQTEGMRVYASTPKKIEQQVPDLKGRLLTLPPPIKEEGGESFSPELTAPGEKAFIGTAIPDPLYGVVDARVAMCQNWGAGAAAAGTSSRKDLEPTPFVRTPSYDAMSAFAGKAGSAHFIDVVPRGGKPGRILADASFPALLDGFEKLDVAPAKGAIVGIGGAGFDDTLSAAIRGVWTILQGVRKGGQVLLVSECGEGLGSRALEMMATGRPVRESGQKGAYVDGAEETFYLAKLKEEYEPLLLSGLPDTYAKSGLGLSTARGSGEAVGRLLNKAGRTAKLNVFPRALECRVASG